MIVRADFHIHTGDDPVDRLTYSSYQAIDHAADCGLHCMAITNHGVNSWTFAYAEYAAAKGILLIPGIEARIEHRDVVILNPDACVCDINTFDELYAYRSSSRLIIAPHPYYPMRYALRGAVAHMHAALDALEISSCYAAWCDVFNSAARRAAKQFDLPLVGNSDAHNLWQIGSTYTEIESASCTCEAIFAAIKKKNTRVVSHPLSTVSLIKFFMQNIIPPRFR